MKYSLNFLGALCAVVLFSVAPAIASVTFTFPGRSGDLGHSTSFTSGSDSVDVTAWSHSGGANANSPFDRMTAEHVYQSVHGLGVRSNRFDNSSLDAVGADELLNFNFGTDVSLVNMVLSLAEGNDEFDMAIDGVDLHIDRLLGTDRINSFIPMGGDGPPARDFLIDFSGVSLDSFQHLSLYTTDTWDDFRVVSITVDIGAVGAYTPEPMSVVVWGLLGGIGLCVNVYGKWRK